MRFPFINKIQRDTIINRKKLTVEFYFYLYLFQQVPITFPKFCNNYSIYISFKFPLFNRAKQRNTPKLII